MLETILFIKKNIVFDFYSSDPLYLYILMYSRHFLEIENNLSTFIHNFSFTGREDLDEIFSKHERSLENILQLFLTLRKHEKENKLQENIGKIFPFFLIIFECGLVVRTNRIIVFSG